MALVAELPFSRLLVAKLNSTGLVTVGLSWTPAEPERRPGVCLLKIDVAVDDEVGSPFLARLFLIEPRSIILLTIFCPWFSLALYLFMTSGVLAIAAEVLAEYLVNSGVLLLLVLDLPSLGTSMFVPSLLGVILANLGLFLTLATAASTWALRAALLGVMTLGAGTVTLPLSFWVTEERVCCKTEETDLPYLLVAA